MKKKALLKILSLVLVCAMLLGVVPVRAAADDLNIPLRESLKGYDPEKDGYYALLPLSFQSYMGQPVTEEEPLEMTDVYLPVLVHKSKVYARLEDFCEISDVIAEEKGNGYCLSIFNRRLFILPDDTAAIFELGEPDKKGQSFLSVSIELGAAPFSYQDEFWVPLVDLSIVFDLMPTVQQIDSQKRVTLFKPRRDAMDALADLYVHADDWRFDFNINAGGGVANTSSKAVTYLDGLFRADPTSWKILAKTLTLSDLWSDWDSTKEDWEQKLTKDLAESLVMAGYDEAATCIDLSSSISSEVLTLAIKGGEKYIDFIGENASDILFGLLKEGYDLPRVKQAAQLIGQLESPENKVFLEKLSKGSETGLNLLSGLLGIVCNVCSYTQRDKIAGNGLKDFLYEINNSHKYMTDASYEQLLKWSGELDKTVMEYSLGKYVRENWFSQTMSALSGDFPYFLGYQLASYLIPGRMKGLEATKSFQLSTIALPLEEEVRDVFLKYIKGFNPASASAKQIAEAMNLAYFYLKSCYTATKLGLQSITDKNYDKSFLEQRCQRILKEAAFFSSAVTEDGAALIGNYNARFKLIKGMNTDRLQEELIPLYMKVKGEVREIRTEIPVEDAHIEILCGEDSCGYFDETPDGAYELTVPLPLPEGMPELAPEALEKTLELTFSSPTVAGEDTVDLAFISKGTEEARTAYLDWATQQLKLIAKNRSVWMEHIPASLNYYSCRISDMDNNHRLEIAVSYTAGTGHFTYSYIYEVNDDITGLVACARADNKEISLDIISDTPVPVYRDKDGQYFQIYEDYLRDGWQLYIYSIGSMSLRDRLLYSEFLCAKDVQNYMDKPSTESFRGPNREAITEEEYNSMPDTRYAGCQKGEMIFHWVYHRDQGNLSDFDWLLQSWEGFSCDLFRADSPGDVPEETKGGSTFPFGK